MNDLRLSPGATSSRFSGRKSAAELTAIRRFRTARSRTCLNVPSPQSRGVTDAVYNGYAYDKEKREALTAWEAQLAVLIAAPR